MAFAALVEKAKSAILIDYSVKLGSLVRPFLFLFRKENVITIQYKESPLKVVLLLSFKFTSPASTAII